MIRLEKLETEELERFLRMFAERAMPYATRHMLNKAGWRGRAIAQELVKRKFVTRNKWTVGSIRTIPTKSLVVRQQEVRIGSTQLYMRHQEMGHTEVAKGKHGVPIPTSYAAGQEGKRPRTRLPRRPNQMRNIKLSRSRKGALTTSQRILRTVQQAVETGNRFVFIDFGPGRRKAIMRVVGGRRAVKRGRKSTAKLKMIQDLSQRTVRIKPTLWLAPTIKKTKKGMEADYRDALMFQLKRNPKFR